MQACARHYVKQWPDIKTKIQYLWELIIKAYKTEMPGQLRIVITIQDDSNNIRDLTMCGMESLAKTSWRKHDLI